MFRLMGLDAERHGTPQWNPLSEFIKPGDRVVIKPNMVQHFHEYGGELDAVVTHGSLVRAVADYVLLALRCRGRLTIGDAPLQLADFGAVAAKLGLPALREFYTSRGVDIDIADFRHERAEKDSRGIVIARENLSGDPLGYKAVDLDGASAHAQGRRPSSLYSADYFGFRVTNYNPGEMLKHHGEKTHEYLISGSVLASDVLIGLPKLKTHRKAGLTCALKNMVGINGNKDWLPHHAFGSVEEGGDEYSKKSLRKRWLSALNDRIEASPSVARRRALYWVGRAVSATRRLRPYPDTYAEGSWYGNDTLWRTILDLNAILAYADADGRIGVQPRRRLLHVVDAVVAGEGEGPLGSDPKPCGLLLAGTSAAAVDAACATFMGFDIAKIPLIRKAFEPRTPALVDFSPADILVDAEAQGLKGALRDLKTFGFKPAAGWMGHIER